MDVFGLPKELGGSREKIQTLHRADEVFVWEVQVQTHLDQVETDNKISL